MNARNDAIQHGRVFVQIQPHVREGCELALSYERLRNKSYAFALDDVDLQQNQKHRHENRNHHAVHHVELGPHAGRAHHLFVSAGNPCMFSHILAILARMNSMDNLCRYKNAAHTTAAYRDTDRLVKRL